MASEEHNYFIQNWAGCYVGADPSSKSSKGLIGPGGMYVGRQGPKAWQSMPLCVMLCWFFPRVDDLMAKTPGMLSGES